MQNLIIDRGDQMYWRLTSKEKPIKHGKIKVIAAWRGEKPEDTKYEICRYYANEDKFLFIEQHDRCGITTPTHWSHIDELPCEDK